METGVGLQNRRKWGWKGCRSARRGFDDGFIVLEAGRACRAFFDGVVIEGVHEGGEWRCGWGGFGW